MKNRFISYLIIFSLLLGSSKIWAQEMTSKKDTYSGWFSVGGRSTLSLFDGSGSGLGTGGQFRIQLSNQVNTDWFADYITINVQDKVRSDYYHIGWSVLFYPIKNSGYPKVIQPYILAGHCFDFNKKTSLLDPSISQQRWGSAVQAGVGTHFNFTQRFDVSLTCQYMIHLTKELEVDIDGNNISISAIKPSTLEGHLLTTISLNYKIFKLWNR